MKSLVMTLIFACWASVAGIAIAFPRTPQAEGEPFSITISAVDPVEAQGFGVAIRVRMTNMSEHKISGSGTYQDLADVGFEYSVRRVGGAPLRGIKHEGPFMGSAMFRTLDPGESMEEVTDIGHLYLFTPGKYTIQLSRSISTNPKAGVVKSNTIQVAILPPHLSIGIEAPERLFKAGSQISLMVRLTNTSGLPMAVPALGGGKLDPTYSYWCYDSTGKPVMRPEIRTEQVSAGQTQILKPDKSYDESVPVSAACNLSKPGEYRVLLGRPDPYDPKRRDVKSNEITVGVIK
jgi:hypothetical protein